jgi:cation diffusion facilitator family transporter
VSGDRHSQDHHDHSGVHDSHGYDDHRNEHHGHGHRHQHGPEGHSHGGVDAAILGSHEALRTLWRSLIILGVTAALQLVVVALSGSVALLADAVHNVGDALTAVPLAAAFILSRRPPTRRLTYGFGRTEDLAGLTVLVIILFSAAYAAYEAVQHIIHPQTPGLLWAVAAAGAIGFVGNEWVAVYRIRTGRRIGSAALVADGYHARIDGFTSLAVIVGAVGVALGFRLADPIVGLVISIVILRIVWTSAKEIVLRMLDGIDPEVVDEIRHQAGHVDGVLGVEEVRARWVGHGLRSEVTVVVAADVTVAEGHEVAMAVRRRLLDVIDHLTEAIIHVDPASAAGEACHS